MVEWNLCTHWHNLLLHKTWGSLSFISNILSHIINPKCKWTGIQCFCIVTRDDWCPPDEQFSTLQTPGWSIKLSFNAHIWTTPQRYYVLPLNSLVWWEFFFVWSTSFGWVHIKKSLMAEWLEWASQWHEVYCHDLEVMSSNHGQVELGVWSSVPSRTWIKIYI